MKQKLGYPTSSGRKFQPLITLFILWMFITGACQTLMGPNGPAQPVDQLPTGTPVPAQTEEPPALESIPTQPPTIPAADTVEAPTELATRNPSPTLGMITPTQPGQSSSGENALGALTCAPSTVTADTIQQMTAESWLDWVEKLSGAEPVTIGGEETTIKTRFSPSMFNGQENARAFDFVLEQVQGWYPEDQIEVMDFTVTRQSDNQEFTWKNLILTLPGTQAPEEIVMMTAHLDSTTSEDPEEFAPGASDNGSGSATLLEAARLLRDVSFERTIKIIWFTGEEQGLLGSANYVETIEEPDAVAGVINLDMFGYDSDDDRCFEIHVGTMPESEAVGQCFVDSIEAYDLNLPRYDYLTDGAISASDHASFWEAEIGAIEILENLFTNGLAEGCTNGDGNPHYHSERDTVDRLNPETSVEIARAALAAVMGMAEPLQ